MHFCVNNVSQPHYETFSRHLKKTRSCQNITLVHNTVVIIKQCVCQTFFHVDLKKTNKMLDLFFLQQQKTMTTGYLAISEHSEIMDGKHTVLQAPVSSGINFCNYKHCSVCFGQRKLQFPIRGCGLPGKNFRWKCLQKLQTVRENGEGFFSFSTINTFDWKKEAISLFLCC